MVADAQSAASATQSAACEPGLVRGAASARTIALTGVIVSGLVAGAVALPPSLSGAGGGSELRAVALADLGAASVSLDPGSAVALTSQARECKAPLAVITLARASDAPSAPIRIRAGAYVSPLYNVGAAPVRVAVPFPAAYPVGKGQLIVEGLQEDLNVSLYPTWASGASGAAKIINVWWHTDRPCGR